ncbi:hypothetical protein J8J04_02775 ['Fragaria x ananassa' phyllody phytoplasma]|uniref:Uncharacterized protein n=1 Tax='Fragaria x ananassa' phyllody phytoplasma TaxID=2358428 RepID=A0ABS5K467_9MOLU|nr:hypothetical protein ['Fragaria x ananassa' phyllody phytoplasma]
MKPSTLTAIFKNKQNPKLKLTDYETLQQEWLNTQPKFKRQDINVLDKKDIPNILKYFDIQTSIYGLEEPSYNPYNKQFFDPKLKNPHQGLLGLYFKHRTNPFNIKYPYDEDYEYTLEDLLKYEIAIEEVFVFWDVKQKTNKDNPNIQLIVSNIFIGQNKEEIINQYLINNNIIKEPKLIKLGCYNATPNTGLVVPLPQEILNDVQIDAIYFDDGIRIMNESPKKQFLKEFIKTLQKIQKRRKKLLKEIEVDNLKQLINEQIKKYEEQISTYKQEIAQLPGNIEDLLKLSNGAKNIYLFVFETQKKPIHINLPDSLNPYEAIRDWKRDNDLYAYKREYNKQTHNGNNLITITEPSYKEINISYTVNLIINTFETEDKIYRIICQDVQPKRDILINYQKDYVKWLEQCYIQYGCTYQGETIRNKLGRLSRILYDENSKTHYYKYEEGFLSDNWYIDDYDCCSGGDRWQTRTYYQFLDTTPPPKKPDILNS